MVLWFQNHLYCELFQNRLLQTKGYLCYYCRC